MNGPVLTPEFIHSVTVHKHRDQRARGEPPLVGLGRRVEKEGDGVVADITAAASSPLQLPLRGRNFLCLLSGPGRLDTVEANSPHVDTEISQDPIQIPARF